MMCLDLKFSILEIADLYNGACGHYPVVEPVGGDITVMAETDLLELGPQSSAEMKMHEHATQFQKRMQKGATTSEGDDILEERVMGEAAMQASIGETMGVTEKRKSDSSGRCFYTHLPRLIKRAGLVGSELTALNLDKVCPSSFTSFLVVAFRQLKHLGSKLKFSSHLCPYPHLGPHPTAKGCRI